MTIIDLMSEREPKPLSPSDRNERIALFKSDNAYRMWVRDFFLFTDNKKLREENWKNIRARRREYLNPSVDPYKLLDEGEHSYPDLILSTSAA